MISDRAVSAFNAEQPDERTLAFPSGPLSIHGKGDCLPPKNLHPPKSAAPSKAAIRQEIKRAAESYRKRLNEQIERLRLDLEKCDSAVKKLEEQQARAHVPWGDDTGYELEDKKQEWRRARESILEQIRRCEQAGTNPLLLLLADIKIIFAVKNVSRLPGAELAKTLRELGGKNIMAANLARWLKVALKIDLRNIKLTGGKVRQGYLREQFIDVWNR